MNRQSSPRILACEDKATSAKIVSGSKWVERGGNKEAVGRGRMRMGVGVEHHKVVSLVQEDTHYCNTNGMCW